MKKKIILLLVFCCLSVILTGCNTSEKNQTSDEKIVLTALYWKELPEFEALVESTYTDIDLQIERSTSAVYNSDIQRRLKNGHGTDLVFTSIPNGEILNFMLDLSANSFSNRFASATMEIIEQDGKMYFLPLPSLYRGVIINKTLIEEMGQKVPETMQELVDTLLAVKNAGAGISPDGYCFGIGDLDGIALGEWGMSFAVPEFLGTIKGEQWAADFINKTAKAQGVLEKYLQEAMKFTELGLLDASRTHVMLTDKNALDVIGMMSTRELTACYAASTTLADIRERNSKDEFIMLPILSRAEKHAWTVTSPEAYLGINAAVKEDEKKLEAAYRVMDLYATAKGQTAVLNDTNTDSSYLTSEEVPYREDITGLERYVEEGYVYHVNRFGNDVLWLIGKNIAEVCNGKMTLEEAMASVDAVNNGAPLSEKDDYTLIGSVSEDLIYENYNTRRGETAIGNLIADAVREVTGADFAFTNGGGIRASLYQGDIFVSDLAAVSPYNNYLTVLEVKGEIIYEMLENSISGIYYKDVPNGRFLQVSGLCYAFSFDKSTEVTTEEAADGVRVPCAVKLLRVTLPDGTELDKNGTYTIAVTDYMSGISGYESAGDGYTMLNVFDDTAPKRDGVALVEARKDTARDALIAYFRNHSTELITAQLEGRIIAEEAK